MKRLPIFYTPPESILSDFATLDRGETQHLSKVLRLKKGDLVIVVDGLGMAYKGEVDKIGRNDSTVRLHDTMRNFGEPSVKLTLAAAMATGDKFDTVIQKGTELGVKRFVPILSERSQLTFNDPKRIKTRVTRLEKVAMSAIKQCQRAYRPDISPPTRLAEFLKQTDPESLNLIFHPGGKAVPFDQVEIDPDIKRVALLVGPESGFSDDELIAASEAGFQSVSLGERILRAETAGPTVCALVMNALGEFR